MYSRCLYLYFNCTYPGFQADIGHLLYHETNNPGIIKYLQTNTFLKHPTVPEYNA